MFRSSPDFSSLSSNNCFSRSPNCRSLLFSVSDLAWQLVDLSPISSFKLSLSLCSEILKAQRPPWILLNAIGRDHRWACNCALWLCSDRFPDHVCLQTVDVHARLFHGALVFSRLMSVNVSRVLFSSVKWKASCFSGLQKRTSQSKNAPLHIAASLLFAKPISIHFAKLWLVSHVRLLSMSQNENSRSTQPVTQLSVENSLIHRVAHSLY